MDQLNQILHYLGTPNEETLARIGSPRAQEYVRNLPFMPKVPFQKLFPNANPDALDLLDKMLAFDPTSRITVEEALEHRYLSIWHDSLDEPNCPTGFDFSFEVVDEVPQMREMILQEVIRFRNEVRRQPQTNQAAPFQDQKTDNINLPENRQQPSDAPRPHEMQDRVGDLEHELAYGLDGRISHYGDPMQH